MATQNSLVQFIPVPVECKPNVVMFGEKIKGTHTNTNPLPRGYTGTRARSSEMLRSRYEKESNAVRAYTRGLRKEGYTVESCRRAPDAIY